jgi:hypothetical protein
MTLDRPIDAGTGKIAAASSMVGVGLKAVAIGNALRRNDYLLCCRACRVISGAQKEITVLFVLILPQIAISRHQR